LQIRTNNALVQSFAVNALNQLTTSTRSGTLTVGGVVNIPATNVTVNGQTASNYLGGAFAKDGFTIATNGWNSYTAIAQTNGLASTNTINAYLPLTNNYKYDLNGNLTNLAGVPTAQQLALGYDDENQLTSVIAPGLWKGEFTYDGKMRLRVRKEYRWTGSSWALTNETRTVQDGMLVVQERDAGNKPTITYTRGRDLSGSLEGAGGIGGLLALTEHSQPLYPHSYYHADGNGNVTALVGTNGAVVARYAYDPFGNTTLATGGKAQINRYRFSSKEHHDRSGLVYYGYRWYAPELQRWVNRDPIEEEGGINLHRFASNEPIGRIDFEGLWWGPAAIKAAGLLAKKWLAQCPARHCRETCEACCNSATKLGSSAIFAAFTRALGGCYVGGPWGIAACIAVNTGFMLYEINELDKAHKSCLAACAPKKSVHPPDCCREP
jgi:RHS repeat-associated protein